MKNISDIVEGKPGASDKALAEGVHIAGVRFVATKIEGRSMYCRSVSDPFQSLLARDVAC